MLFSIGNCTSRFEVAADRVHKFHGVIRILMPPVLPRSSETLPSRRMRCRADAILPGPASDSRFFILICGDELQYQDMQARALSFESASPLIPDDAFDITDTAVLGHSSCGISSQSKCPSTEREALTRRTVQQVQFCWLKGMEEYYILVASQNKNHSERFGSSIHHVISVLILNVQESIERSRKFVSLNKPHAQATCPLH